jgi:hypothetical protein
MSPQRPNLGARLWQLICRAPILPGFALCLTLLGIVVACNPDSRNGQAKRQVVDLPTPLPVFVTSQALQTATASPLALVAAAPLPPTSIPPPTPSTTPILAAPVAAPLPPSAPEPRLLLDQRFVDKQPGWPDDQQSTAWFENGVYRLAPRAAGRHVAVGAPIPGVFRDVQASATFHKVGGPPGGGYGLILRDQGPGPRDGRDQGGRYYVLEIGDRGEVGIFRRDVDHWTDLVPFTPSPAVKPGGESNSLTARAIGSRLSLLVNGAPVADFVDTTLTEGSLGIYVAGDGNDVVLEQVRFEALN